MAVVTSKRVLITGANRGLGLEFAKQYLARGDRVFATARDPNSAGQLNELAKTHGDRILIVPLNVASEKSIKQARDAVGPQAESLDLLINNAGIYAAKVGADGQPV